MFSIILLFKTWGPILATQVQRQAQGGVLATQTVWVSPCKPAILVLVCAVAWHANRLDEDEY